MNRLIELVTPRIFDMNQRLINYAINNLIVPKINQILTMFSVVVPSTKFDVNPTVYLRELDGKIILKYLSKYPIKQDDNVQFTNILFNENFSSDSKIYKNAIFL